MNYSKHAFKGTTLEKFAINLAKNNQLVFRGHFPGITLKISGIFFWELCVVWFLFIPFLWEECFQSIWWLNTRISHKNSTTKACIFGAKRSKSEFSAKLKTVGLHWFNPKTKFQKKLIAYLHFLIIKTYRNSVTQDNYSRHRLAGKHIGAKFAVSVKIEMLKHP